MTPQQIMAVAFNDELEKLSGARRVVRIQQAISRKGHSRGLSEAAGRAKRKYLRRIGQGTSPLKPERAAAESGYLRRIGASGDLMQLHPSKLPRTAAKAVRGGPKLEKLAGLPRHLENVGKAIHEGNFGAISGLSTKMQQRLLATLKGRSASHLRGIMKGKAGRVYGGLVRQGRAHRKGSR